MRSLGLVDRPLGRLLRCVLELLDHVPVRPQRELGAVAERPRAQLLLRGRRTGRVVVEGAPACENALYDIKGGPLRSRSSVTASANEPDAAHGAHAVPCLLRARPHVRQRRRP
jgi:hypothetical protein